LIRLYWDIGRLIVERPEREGWGKGIVAVKVGLAELRANENRGSSVARRPQRKRNWYADLRMHRMKRN
jgi:hypothetical protein